MAAESESPSPNIVIPYEWANAAETVTYGSVASPIAFICGPKNSGKTTFSRHLVNVLLRRYKKVAYLDTDVGQTEFTPPGLVSLVMIDKTTPDVTIPCLKTPARCFFFGDISSKRDPATYVSYIKKLYEHYLKEYNTNSREEIPGKDEVPLVINTPGWVKGIGYEILVDLLRIMSPTHVVKIQISAWSKNLPSGTFWLDEENSDLVSVIEINAALQDHMKRSVLVRKDANLLRDLRLMAYFRQCFPRDMTISTIKELARAIAAHPPYEVPISSIKIEHRHCKVPATEKFYSLNATIVGLATSSDPPQCVGLGIVRGIDTFKGVLYIITPVPPPTLENVDMLIQGFIQIPTSLLQMQGCVSPYMSSNVLSTK
ncbi:polynucleotide 5'-hydroxyl-kinase NOL9 [Andrographis paniculata]|uniref:polynucleotide 5'-hydroxyl-kinase NOL9 n=1 Tax=Andrographis paniculata TaxID=175694 RepID=UPI0021E72202|nr:polynucleotide 5'-hydroxyl-kinase NOL9 [Andrographis paniculata]XP_051116954.1 polynucleotide 5'-hydroxyl-kinase NOL9 [Andrographis paniculata]XP_051116955.1 polynucleotide 5'-hydroxyl-kinase NOL9 [Andrographis paniculata]